MKVLVTGVAGFIGMHIAEELCRRGAIVCGVDNLNDYYDVSLKIDRLNKLKPLKNFQFHKVDIADKSSLFDIFKTFSPSHVVNLAAQAGVRYSLINPDAYIVSNIIGFLHILEACRHFPVEHLLYASSSSVYGGNRKIPFSENDRVDRPVSLYAATKKSNELMAHSYSHIFKVPATGLRFFTVYGPYGRPDMSPMIFAKAILDGNPIDIFNYGDMLRDFTYIDDVVQSSISLLISPPSVSNYGVENADYFNDSSCPHRVVNVGNSNPVALNDFISTLERHLGKEAKKNFLPIQPGDVPKTFACTELLSQLVGYLPSTTLDVGIQKFVLWYKNFHNATRLER